MEEADIGVEVGECSPSTEEADHIAETVDEHSRADDGNSGRDCGGASPVTAAGDMHVEDETVAAVEARGRAAQGRRPACGSSCRRKARPKTAAAYLKACSTVWGEDEKS